MLRTARIGLVAIVAIVAAHLLDGWAWAHLVDPRVYEHDLGRMFRIVGYLPLWLLLALALWLSTGERRRAVLLAAAPTLGGVLAEVLKILLRRERPNLHDGAYVFRSFADQPFATKALGLPSSHALVAFAAAWMLARFYPRATAVWIVLGVGCAVTRVQAHAHFLSDVVVAGVAAFVLVEVLWRRWGSAPPSRAP